MVEIIVGNEREQAVLHAHQAFLVESPYFKKLTDAFSADVTVSYSTIMLRGTVS